MFDWLRKKRRDAPPASGHVHIEGQQTSDLDPVALVADRYSPVPGAQFKALDPAQTADLAARAGEGKPIPFGRWVWMELPWELKERFLGYVYLDPEAGPSAKGGPESASQIAELPTYTVRLPMRLPMQLLTPEEITKRALPVIPAWLHHYGPQPDPEAAWRKDPDLKGRFHDSYPDDLQVLVHDGEPRRTSRQPELCWVRIVEAKEGPPRRFIFMPQATSLSESEFARKYRTNKIVYVGKLLNAPHALQSVRQGDTVRFFTGGGLEQPLQVTLEYLEERENWRIVPCNKCGMGECLDPPSVMAKLRFPDQPPDAVTTMFTSFCPRCGGMQMLSRHDQAEQ
ncbi:MAG TPA: hypothetical protein VF516_46175 [Kofleriaceae bacterium]